MVKDRLVHRQPALDLHPGTKPKYRASSVEKVKNQAAITICWIWQNILFCLPPFPKHSVQYMKILRLTAQTFKWPRVEWGYKGKLNWMRMSGNFKAWPQTLDWILHFFVPPNRNCAHKEIIWPMHEKVATRLGVALVCQTIVFVKLKIYIFSHERKIPFNPLLSSNEEHIPAALFEPPLVQPMAVAGRVIGASNPVIIPTSVFPIRKISLHMCLIVVTACLFFSWN